MGNEYDRPQGCLLRVFWMAVGNVALLTLAGFILSQGRFSLLDGGYWAVVAALVGARYADIVRFRGQTADGTPATVTHLRRYALGLLAVAVGLWIAAHVLGRLL